MRRLFVILAGLSVCLLQGCVLGIGWLPDSSGFVFTTPKGDLVLYDCATKKQRVIVQDNAAATTAWPALSPDGKTIALAHLEAPDGKDAMLQIVLYSLKGQAEVRSEKIKWAAIKGKDFEYTTQLYWSPDGKKLIVHGQGLANSGAGFDNTALFDVATKKSQLWEQHVPGVFGGSPVRPDGAGFLLGRVIDNGGALSYHWADWTGKLHKMRATEAREEEDEITPWTALINSRWDGDRAVLTLPKVNLVIDTKKLEERVEKARREESFAGKEAIRMRAVLASGVELLMLEQHDEKRGIEAVRVVARKKGEDKLTEVVAPISDHLLLLSASPSRKYAIVRDWYGYRGKKSDVIHVIDEKGKLHDTIAVNVRN